jgi:hypothetical protein
MDATVKVRIDLPNQRKLRRFKRFLNRHTDTLTMRFGASEADGMRREMLEEYRPIAPQVPYVGGRRNRYTPALALSAWALAMYRVLLRHGGSVQDAGEILHYYAKSSYERIPTLLRTRMLPHEGSEQKSRRSGPSSGATPMTGSTRSSRVTAEPSAGESTSPSAAW